MSEIKIRLLNKASELFDIHKRDLDSDIRFAFIMPARFAMYKALRERGWSYPRIGKLFGKDHSTIMYGVSRADYMIERDEEYAAQVLHLASMRLTPAPISSLSLEEQLMDLREKHGWQTEYSEDSE